MKSKLDRLLQKGANKPSAKRLSDDQEVEIVSSEMALEVRGGDKDYSPTYEHQAENQRPITGPSILLNG